MSARPTILIVNDHDDERAELERALATEFHVRTAATADAALVTLRDDWIQIVLSSQSATLDGIDMFGQVGEHWPDVLCMLLVDADDDAGVARARRDASVYQYVTRPWHPQSLTMTLRNAADVFALRRENELLSIELKLAPDRHAPTATGNRRARPPLADDDGIVRTPQSCLNNVCERLRQVSPFDISVLLTGESGTGKELAARALHNNSLRWEKPFVAENCAALPDELLESELFGCVKGAYTGAAENRIGLFERASGGTVFLDEIGEISPAFQVKLLRVLEADELRPLGAASTRPVDVRVVAATNRNLEADVESGRFREDLYYRLAAVTICMPPLRQRRGDIPALAQALLEKATRILGKPATGFSDEALACMARYRWPGNVRELQDEIQRMLVLCPDTILGAEYLSGRVLRAQNAADRATLDASAQDGTLKTRIRCVEASILREAMVRNRWNKSRAARELGLSRVGLRNKLERYDLAPNETATMAASG